MRFYLLCFSILLVPALNAQPMTTTSFSDLEQGVRNTFFNECVYVSNITFTGSQQSIGEYNSTLGDFFNSGLIISTGVIWSACGPNDVPNEGYDLGLPGDPYLESLEDLGDGSFDAAILEFDFVSETDSIIAGGFVFGSEEFPEYYNTEFNDMFAISIVRNDTGYQMTYNMAQIPSTGEPVGISSIAPDGSNVLYVQNPNGAEILQWDGYTQPVSFSHDVIPGVSYHVRISIADMSDGIYDSGVLFANGSFACAQDFYASFITLQPDTTANPQTTDMSVDSYNYRIVDGLLYIDCSKYVNVFMDIGVFDLSGRPVSQRRLTSIGATEVIDMQSVSTGIYILRIISRGSIIVTHKFLR